MYDVSNDRCGTVSLEQALSPQSCEAEAILEKELVKYPQTKWNDLNSWHFEGLSEEERSRLDGAVEAARSIEGGEAMLDAFATLAERLCQLAPVIALVESYVPGSHFLDVFDWDQFQQLRRWEAMLPDTLEEAAERAVAAQKST